MARKPISVWVNVIAGGVLLGLATDIIDPSRPISLGIGLFAFIALLTTAVFGRN